MQINKAAMKTAFPLLVTLLLAVILSHPCPGRAEKNENPETAPAITAATIEERVEELQRRLTACTESDNAETAGKLGSNSRRVLKQRNSVVC